MSQCGLTCPSVVWHGLAWPPDPPLCLQALYHSIRNQKLEWAV